MAVTQHVTVLFTDLVGSTALSASLSPEAADEVRRAHFAVLREAVSANGGTEVKTTGDGLMVRFDATAPALSCAVAMQQGIERYNRTSSVAHAIRIGISTGDVAVEDGDYFGETVVEAARLCSAAQGGQVLTTHIVKGLARRSGHSFATERELELKGLPEPVIAWEVVWEPAEADETDKTGIPLPPRLPPAAGIGLIGRRVELERLTQAVKAVAAGEPARIVLVSGEAGLGKSTLTATLARDAHRGGAIVLYGRCDEDLALPHQPFVEVLDHYFAHTADDVLSNIGDRQLAALAHLTAEIETRRPGLGVATSSDPDAERWLLYGAVLAVLERASRQTLIVMMLDDLHWADRPTLQLLRHIASHRPGRLLVLGTYRETDLLASHPLTETLAALTREPAVSRLSLSGLQDDEVVSFMEAAAGQTLDDAGVGLAHALYQETDGNPFFLAEVLRHLVETRAIVQGEDGRWVPTQELSDAGLPDSVRQVIGSRVGRLGDEAARVLSAASVLGQEFDLDLLASVLGSMEDPVLDVLEAAASAALVAEVRGLPGRYRFAHALIQHTLYEGLGGTRRARLHRAAAEALEELLGIQRESRAGELARHWLSATKPAESAKAVTYARIAGESALASLAPAEAMRWFSEALGALAHAPDDEERARCLAGLGEAQRQVGDASYRETLLDSAHLALRVGDPETLVRAALANNRGFQSAAGIVDAERVEVVSEALDAIGEADSSSRCRLLALLALERTYDGDYPTRRALSDEALGIARRLGDPTTLFDVLRRRWQAIWMADTVEELYGESAEGERLAEEMDDPVASFWAATARSVFAIQVGDISEVGRTQSKAVRIASEVGQPILKWTSTFNNAWATLLGGDIERGETQVAEALQMGNETGQPDCFSIYAVQLLNVRWCQGRLAELLEVVVQMANDNPGLSPARSAAARTLIEAGRDDEAESMLEAELSSGFSCPEDFLVPTYLEGWARVASHLNNGPAAEALYERLRRWPRLVVFGGPMCLGAVVHHLGTLATVLGRYDDAEAHFLQALETHENLNAPFFTALTQLEWARMLLIRRTPDDLASAETMLHDSKVLAERHGFAGVERRAREELSKST